MLHPSIRDRYVRDPGPIRLGGLAADLARIASFSENPKNKKVITTLLEEAKYFAEWAAPEAPLETQAVLAEIQIALAVWERRWRRGAPDPSMRTEAQHKADELLALAGLVDKSDAEFKVEDDK